jgi:ATP-dependent Clp protease ATP-binding subunit ClpC
MIDMRISEDSAKILAVAGEIADAKHTTLIRDTLLFSAMLCTDTIVKDIIEENTPNMNALLDAMAISDFESAMDRDSMKVMADRAFEHLRVDVRRILSSFPKTLTAIPSLPEKRPAERKPPSSAEPQYLTTGPL